MHTVSLTTSFVWEVPNVRPKACHNVVILYMYHDLSIGTCFLGGGGVVVAKILALYAFDRSYTL